MTFDSKTMWTPLAQGDPPYFFKNPDHIKYDFDQGTPDPNLYPMDELARIAREVLERNGPKVLDYTDPDYGYKSIFMGWDPLREEVARYLGSREARTPDIDELILVNGSANGVGIASRAFLEAGDAVIVEAATFPFALRYFGQAGATVFGAAIDADGMDPDSVAEKLAEAKKQGLRPKMIYTIPTGQLPTGTIMPLERRRRLLELAEEWNVLVLEDTIYNPFQYEGEVVPTLWSLDTTGRVMQSDSFGKTIAPGTRIGWMLGSPSTTLGMATVRQDLGASPWLMNIVHQYLTEDRLLDHIAKSVELYRSKRDVVERALEAYCGDFVSWDTPKAAFYYWLRLSDQVDWEKAKSEIDKAGIAMRPGERFIGQQDGAMHMRMSFGHAGKDELEMGMKTFGETLRGCLK